MTRKISDYTEIIRIYNTAGRSQAYSYIREHYAVKNPYCVIKRMKQSAVCNYDESSDRFMDASASDVDNVFINLNELCQVDKAVKPIQAVGSGMTMERLIKELIEDRLLQLSHYIQMNQAKRTVMVDQSSMISDGYQVVIY
jgi:molybdopterin converting factor small subunit